MRRQVDSASERECRAGTLQQAPDIACEHCRCAEQQAANTQESDTPMGTVRFAPK